MNWFKFPHQLTIIAFGLALAMAIDTCCLTQIQAQPAFPVDSTVRFVPPPPPDRGAPSGRQKGGASRGQCPAVEKPLTALVPAAQETLGKSSGRNPALTTWESVWGLTVSESPTLWFYVPYSLISKFSIEFVLQDEQDNDVYPITFTASPTQAGIVRVSLPASTVSLEVGRMYHWYFLVDCDRDVSPLVEGWVQRVAINPTLMSQLPKATPQQRAVLYAANGIWYDALTTLAELRRANPGDAKLLNDWVSLLHSVSLDAIANEPITQCCTLEIWNY